MGKILRQLELLLILFFGRIIRKIFSKKGQLKIQFIEQNINRIL